MKLKKVVGLFLVLILTSVFAVGCGGSSTSQGETDESVKLVLAHSANPENSLSIAYDKFAELVEEKSNGQLVIEVHGSGTLAGDQTAVEGAKLGTIDIGSCASNNMSGFTDAFLFADLPYIFDSIESSHKVWWGEIGEELKQKVEEDVGVKVLFYLDTGGGFRVLANNQKVVKTPDDLKGLKLRATASPIEIALLEAWGANPTPVAWPEVYSALEQKVVVGEHLHPGWIYEANHYEALKYMTEVNAMANVHVAVMNLNSWNNLTPELQQVIIEAGKEIQEFAAQLDAEKGQKAMQSLLDEGLELYKPTPEESKQWRDLGVQIWPEFYDKVPEEFINKVIEAQK